MCAIAGSDSREPPDGGESAGAWHGGCGLIREPSSWRPSTGDTGMLSPLKVGTVLLQDDTFIPESVWISKETFCPGWQAITNLTAEDLDRQIRVENWNLMFMAGALHGTSWGSWSDIAIRCAAIRVLRKANLAEFNGVGVSGIRK